ncbi:hypothetical protein ACMGD3_23685 [Lysinibacillus sphaericus]|uniref:hypothetical protein n=1 Tax=Lysinibacillus sphaericus TaxID=1421 RepID=UPI001C5F0846
MQVDLTEFNGLNVKIVATIDQTLYRNVGAVILYEEDSHILSVRKLKRKIADQYIPTEELQNFTFDSKAAAIKFTHKLTRMSALDYLLVTNRDK